MAVPAAARCAAAAPECAGGQCLNGRVQAIAARVTARLDGGCAIIIKPNNPVSVSTSVSARTFLYLFLLGVFVSVGFCSPSPCVALWSSGTVYVLCFMFCFCLVSADFCFC
jgi:hypothetical protein